MLKGIESKIESFIDSYINNWPFSGVVYAAEGGDVIFSKGYGMASIEFGRPNSPDTLFAMASISKQFTSYAIMQLADKGLLDLDKPANLYLPDKYRINENITLHHLMSHTSGMYNPDILEDDFYGGFNKTYYSKDKYYNDYMKRPLINEPGKKYDYNNIGYSLQAWIVENITGAPFDDCLKENIFKPLSMDAICRDDGLNILKNKASQYTIDGGDVVRAPYYNQKYSLGAGGLVCSCKDLHKWFLALKANSLKLSEKAERRFYSENLDNYCYGLQRHEIYGKERFSHTGSHMGMRNFVQYFFKDGIVVIVLANNDVFEMKSFGKYIADIIFTGAVPKPVKPAPYKLPENLVKNYQGVYLDRKIELKFTENGWLKVSEFDEISEAVYPISDNQFVYKYKETPEPLEIKKEGGKLFFMGYKKL